jgi:hypothetical protein
MLKAQGARLKAESSRLKAIRRLEPYISQEICIFMQMEKPMLKGKEIKVESSKLKAERVDEM